MRKIDLETWSRGEHFRVYSTFDIPHFSMCADVDLTAFYPLVNQSGVSFTVAIVYILARAANAVPEFRFRIRTGEVVEHEIVHPSTTILTRQDLFSFCTFDYVKDFSLFAPRATRQIAQLQEQLILTDEPGRDDLLFMTSIPWVSFTSFMHPLRLHPADSIPRFAWGKYYAEGKRLKMPLSVQAHHALMDGIHMGRFYAEVEAYLQQPEVVLG